MADKAILVGINRYKSVNPLRGCVNDVKQMKRLLAESFGFAAENVKTLLDDAATKGAIGEHLDWLLSDLRPGDRAVFHFSGHGSYTADRTGESEDGRDELICLYDMDWGNPGSYFLDKELRKRFDPLTPGVLLVVLDCCHSGNGTRLVDFSALAGPYVAALETAAVQPARALVIETDTQRRAGKWPQAMSALGFRAEAGLAPAALPAVPAQQQAVIAKFVAPPAEVEQEVRLRRSTARARAKDREIGEAKMTETLLAACRRDQTAADAFVDGDYHGAFTHTLSGLLRPEVSRQDLLRRVREELRKQGFEQEPQLEGRTHEGPLFSTSVATEPVRSESGASFSAAAQRRILDLLTELRGLVLGEPGGVPARAVPQRCVVYVHGICWHDAGYSDPWWAAMGPYVPGLQPGTLGQTRREVLWSDLVRPSRDLARSLSEGRALSQQLRDVLEDRAEQQVAAAAPSLPEGAMPLQTATDRAMLGIPGLDCIEDFTIYLLDEHVRSQVIGRFQNALRPLLESGTQVELISHSWGTVVAYEALCGMEASSWVGSVSNFFTVGAALSIREVKRRLLPEARNGHRPAMVKRWINLDARGDVVGGSLKGNPYAVDAEFLGLEPAGCPLLLGLASPACAHSSYFQAENVAVNQGIFGRLIAP
jgi:hypothetical protein